MVLSRVQLEEIAAAVSAHDSADCICVHHKRSWHDIYFSAKEKPSRFGPELYPAGAGQKAVRHAALHPCPRVRPPDTRSCSSWNLTR